MANDTQYFPAVCSLQHVGKLTLIRFWMWMLRMSPGLCAGFPITSLGSAVICKERRAVRSGAKLEAGRRAQCDLEVQGWGRAMAPHRQEAAGTWGWTWGRLQASTSKAVGWGGSLGSANQLNVFLNRFNAGPPDVPHRLLICSGTTKTVGGPVCIQCLM